MPIDPTPAASANTLPAHAPLPQYYHDEDEHQRFLRRMFDDTAVDYERVERLLALGSGSWYRRQALQRAGLAPGQHMLDVGIGTGLLARQALSLLGPGGRLTGVDPSAGMMAQARLPGVALLQGRAEALPLVDADVDFVSLGYALRHLSDLRAAFAEFARVLRPGGLLLLTTPNYRGLTGRMLGLRWRVVAPEHLGYFTTRTLAASLRTAGFRDVRIRSRALDVFAWRRAPAAELRGLT